MAFFAAPAHAETETPHASGDIVLDRVSKRFGDAVALHRACAAFPCNAVTCIMGASGGGKTTMLRLLMGLETPDEGRIEGMEGRRMAAVFQEDRLCQHLSVAANLRMPHAGMDKAGKRAFLGRARELLDAMGLPDALERPVHDLSGGMKRRVALARAVLADADVLFFDEPLKGLDASTERRVMDAILPMLADKTVFWVTHHESELAYFDDPRLLHIESLR